MLGHTRVPGWVCAAAALAVAVPTAATAAPATYDFSKSIEALSAYDPQATCSPTVKTGTGALRSLVLAAYSGTGDYGIVRDCAIGGTSEHKEGRAWDWKVNAFDAKQDAAAKDFFSWLLATDRHGNQYALARRLGVMYMIYNGHIWSSYNASAGWRPYTGSNPHTDHVHISLSWPGASGTTSYWDAASSTTSPSPSPTASPSPTSTTSTTTSSQIGPMWDRWRALGGADGVLGAPAGDERSVRGGRALPFERGTVYWSSSTGARAMWGDIEKRYDALKGPDGPLGLPTSEELFVSGVPVARMTTFQGGRVVWSASTGAHAVWGSILSRYLALGGPAGVLGLPTSDETAVRGGRASRFQGGMVTWTSTAGTFAVYGDIAKKYALLGGPDSALGMPVTDEHAVKGGRASTFQGGRILWSPGTGAHGVWGDIARRYASLGGPEGRLGLPLTDEVAAGRGRANTFQGGIVTWSSATATKVLWDDIATRWTALRGADGPLGLPVAEEVAVRGGRASAFQGGTVLWSTGTGAHGVWGDIARRYQSTGGPDGPLGFPLTDEVAVRGGRATTFQGGRIYWSLAAGSHAVTGQLLAHHELHRGPDGPLGLPVTGLTDVLPGAQQQVFSGGTVYVYGGRAVHVRGAIRHHYLSTGGPSGALGLPTSDEYAVPEGRRNDFQRGGLTWSSTTGAITAD